MSSHRIQGRVDSLLEKGPAESTRSVMLRIVDEEGYHLRWERWIVDEDGNHVRPAEDGE